MLMIFGFLNESFKDENFKSSNMVNKNMNLCFILYGAFLRTTFFYAPKKLEKIYKDNDLIYL